MNKTEETIREGVLELCIDRDHVTISVERFQELLKAEVKLDLLKGSYLTAKYSSDVSETAKLIFGPKPIKEDDEDA